MLADVMRMNAGLDTRPLLPRLRLPALILHRAGDPWVAVEHARYLASQVPGARLFELAPTLRAPDAQEPARSLSFVLGPDHPLVAIVTQRVAARIVPPYAWYVRVPDLPAFLWRLRPVLADRLVRSTFRGYSGDLTLDFYRGGLLLRFAHGTLVHAGEWQRPPCGGQEQADAAFPPLVFSQLLFGYRRLSRRLVA